jgi:guanine nucleotide-binding protein G(i) subunit alpha
LTLYSFFDEAIRISTPDYMPIEADVLRARTKTTGIYETRFAMGSLSIQYVDAIIERCGS